MWTRHSYNRAFSDKSFGPSLIFALLTFIPAIGASHKAIQQVEKASPLEVHIKTPLRWENGCLNVSLDRINRSLSPLFLPMQGIYISASVTELPGESGKKKGVEWINIYGLTDIGDWEAEPIEPGKAVHSEFCLHPTIPVIDLEKHTWREIAVQGKLRIDAYFFLTKQDWLASKTQREEMLRLSEDELKRLKVSYPQAATVYSPIPCSEKSCAPNCEEPPAVLYGESRVVPDVYRYEEEWVARGHSINEEILRNKQPCSAPKPTSHREFLGNSGISAR
jgi:hypothetical protein